MRMMFDQSLLIPKMQEISNWKKNNEAESEVNGGGSPAQAAA
jgi:hypothetical protein